MSRFHTFLVGVAVAAACACSAAAAASPSSSQQYVASWASSYRSFAKVYVQAYRPCLKGATASCGAAQSAAAAAATRAAARLAALKPPAALAHDAAQLGRDLRSASTRLAASAAAARAGNTSARVWCSAEQGPCTIVLIGMGNVVQDINFTAGVDLPLPA